jgi:hypothetical protein
VNVKNLVRVDIARGVTRYDFELENKPSPRTESIYRSGLETERSLKRGEEKEKAEEAGA